MGTGENNAPAPGSLSTGSPAGRSHMSRDVMRRLNVQSGLRKPNWRAQPSVIVGTEKVSAGSRGAPVLLKKGGPHRARTAGGKVVAPRCVPSTLKFCVEVDPKDHKRFG